MQSGSAHAASITAQLCNVDPLITEQFWLNSGFNIETTESALFVLAALFHMATSSRGRNKIQPHNQIPDKLGY